MLKLPSPRFLECCKRRLEPAKRHLDTSTQVAMPTVLLDLRLCQMTVLAMWGVKSRIVDHPLRLVVVLVTDDVPVGKIRLELVTVLNDVASVVMFRAVTGRLPHDLCTAVQHEMVPATGLVELERPVLRLPAALGLIMLTLASLDRKVRAVDPEIDGLACISNEMTIKL